MKVATTFLAGRMDYHVARLDLRYSLARMPAMPKSGFVADCVKATGNLGASEA